MTREGKPEAAAGAAGAVAGAAGAAGAGAAGAAGAAVETPEAGAAPAAAAAPRFRPPSRRMFMAMLGAAAASMALRDRLSGREVIRNPETGKPIWIGHV